MLCALCNLPGFPQYIWSQNTKHAHSPLYDDHNKRKQKMILSSNCQEKGLQYPCSDKSYGRTEIYALGIFGIIMCWSWCFFILFSLHNNKTSEGMRLRLNVEWLVSSMLSQYLTKLWLTLDCHTKLFCVLFLLKLPSSFWQHLLFPRLAQIGSEFIWGRGKLFSAFCMHTAGEKKSGSFKL